MKLDTNALLKAGGIGAGGMLLLSLLQLIPVVGIVCCCLIWLGYAGIGVLYGVFAKKNGSLMGAGPGALGGAISAAVGGLIVGIVGAISSLIAGTGAAVQALEQLGQAGVDIPPEVYSMYTGAGFGVGAAFLGLCGAIVFSAIMGAIGGAIYGATQKDTVAPAV